MKKAVILFLIVFSVAVLAACSSSEDPAMKQEMEKARAMFVGIQQEDFIKLTDGHILRVTLDGIRQNERVYALPYIGYYKYGIAYDYVFLSNHTIKIVNKGDADYNKTDLDFKKQESWLPKKTSLQS